MKSILCLLFLINCPFCLAQTRKGVYTIHREKNAFGSKSIISGSVVDFATNQPLKIAVVRIDTTLIQTDTLGRFQHELPPGKHQVRAEFIGYYLIDLSRINLRRGRADQHFISSQRGYYTFSRLAINVVVLCNYLT